MMEDMQSRREIKKVVILGGGSAGWITALMAKKYLPKECSVTVIESEEIGILGAGEGTLVNMLNLLEDLNIPFENLIKYASATVKNGVKFTNWNGDNEYIYDNLHDPSSIEMLLNQDEKNLKKSIENYCYLSTFNKINSSEWDLGCFLNNNNKVPFVKTKDSYSKKSLISLHFDASKFALILKEEALKNGILRIQGKAINFINNKYGEVCSIFLENEIKVSCDFLFDCSGFARLVLGKHYGSKRKSHSDVLPVDSAVPFFIPQNKEIPPYTEAIAMKYGWMWKAPLQHRFGCGYTFDSSFISEEEAVKEIEEYLGFEPEYPRKNKGGFKFNAGYYPESWIKNCIAIGLSSGFIEPLESTSMNIMVQSLYKIFQAPHLIYIRNDSVAKDYNQLISEKIIQNLDFVSFHYFSKRNDTDFWKYFKTKSNITNNVLKIKKLWNNNLPLYKDIEGLSFNFYTWYNYANFTDQLSPDIIKEYVLKNNLIKYENERIQLKILQKEISNNCMTHSEFISYIKG